MKKETKSEAIEQLKALLQESGITIVAEYRGMTVAALTELRRKLSSKKIKLQVVKNTLTRIAAQSVNKSGMSKLLVGPNALICSSGDAADVSKALNEYIRATKSILNIKGGLIGEHLLTAEQVISLAALPSRQELLSKVVGCIQSPLASLLTVLNANLGNLVNVLQARVKELEKVA